MSDRLNEAARVVLIDAVASAHGTYRHRDWADWLSTMLHAGHEGKTLVAWAGEYIGEQDECLQQEEGPDAEAAPFLGDDPAVVEAYGLIRERQRRC